MKRFSLLLAYWFLGLLLAMAQGNYGSTDDFNPSSPGDPQMPDIQKTYLLKTQSSPSAGGSTTYPSGAKLVAGKVVNLSASANSNFVFVCWKQGDTILSENRSFKYTMPAENVELTAEFRYSPSSPGDPQMPDIQKTYLLKTQSSPSTGGSTTYPSGTKLVAGKEVSISAFASSGFVFVCWKQGDSILSENRSFNYSMPAENVELTAEFRYSPSSPGNPSPNTWDAPSGTVVMQEFSSGSLRSSIQSLVGTQSDAVKKIVVYGNVSSGDFSLASYFPNCTELDMRHTNLSSTNSSAYENNNTLKHVYLPSTMKSIGSYAFRNCTSLESITCLATTPPSSSRYTFQGLTSAVKLYVPAKSIAAYQATNWGVMDVYPLPGEKALFAVSYIVDGKVVAVDSVEYRTTNIVTPKAPEKEGHTFEGWQNVPETMPAKDITIEGRYSVNKYQIAYLVDGELYAQDSVLYASAIVAPKNPAKEGHTFVAWATADNQQLPDSMPAHDLVMNAVFTTNVYQVTYMLDGEVFKTDSVVYAAPVVAPEMAEKEGHTFGGWQNVPETMPAKDITIEGSYSINKYQIAYLLDGEVYAQDSVLYASAIVAPKNPAKEGHTFVAWATADNQQLPDSMPAHDLVMNAVFTTNVYQVTYMLDGEVFKTDSVVYAAPVVAPEMAEKEGHTFGGWQNIPETMPAKDITIEGRYSVNKYQITYLLDGEVFAIDSVAYKSEISTLEAPEKEGYTFKGWENVPDSMPAQDVTISGSYGINTYQITFLLDGEVFKTDSVVYAAPIIAPEVPVKEYYTFGGWQNVPETMPASDVTIEGSYIANKYMIIYLLDDEVFAIESVAYKSEISTLEAPEKEGYTFNGWENVPDSMPAQDITIVGSYSINTYRIEYLVDDAMYYEDSLVYGAPIVLIEEPVREGYKFSGWSQAPETMPAHDLTISGSFAVGLDAPMLNRAKCDVYSMDGKLLHRAIPVEDLRKTLQPGFYIVGDRKIVVK